jgi:hypothetical protein
MNNKSPTLHSNENTSLPHPHCTTKHEENEQNKKKSIKPTQVHSCKRVKTNVAIYNYSISFIVHILGHAHLQFDSKKVVNPSSSTQFPSQHSKFIAHINHT